MDDQGWFQDLKDAASEGFSDLLGGIQAEGEVGGFDVRIGQRESLPWPLVLGFLAALVLIFAFRS